MEEPLRADLDRPCVTRREHDVLELVATGLTNAEIGTRLGISERTVESHVSSLLHKMAVRNRTALVRARADAPMEGPARFPHDLEVAGQRDRCVGRDRELERLATWWADARSGVTVGVVAGPAGIGKSLLVATAATQAHRGGGRVLFGACTDGPRPPYEPFLAALSEADLRWYERRHGRAVGRSWLLLEPADGREREVIDPAHEQAAVLANIWTCLTRHAIEQPVMLVLEDLHWASSGTLDAVVHIARTGGAAPLLVLATVRDDPTAPTAISALGRLATQATAEVLTLGGLDGAAAASIISAAGSALDPEQAVRDTGGNPLFLRELARGGPGSSSLRGILAARFAQLDDRDLEVVDTATVIGADIDAALIAAALRRQLDDVLDALERIEAIGVIGAGAEHGRFAFTHDVFRSVRHGALGDGRRMRLHAAVADALLDSQRGDLAECARHACLAGPRFDPQVAADLATAAGDAASAATDHGAACAHYRRAIDATNLVTAPRPRARVDLVIRLGAAQVLLGDAEGIVQLQDVGEEAIRRGDPVTAAAAFCALSPAPGGAVCADDARYASLGAQVLAGLPAGESTSRIRVLAILGLHLLLRGNDDRGAAMIDDALADARRSADPYILGRALMTARFVAAPLDIDRRLAYGHELIALGERLREDLFSLVGAQQLCWCHRELGDVTTMARWHATAARMVFGPDLEQLVQEPAAAVLAGDLERASVLTDSLAQVAEPIGMGATYVVPLRSWIADLRGHLPEQRSLELALRRNGPAPRFTEALLARTLARTGPVGRARELLDAAAERQFEPRYAPWQSTTSGACWAEVAFLLGDGRAAAQISEWFAPLAGRFVDGGVQVWDTIDRVHALALLTLGQPTAAAEVAAAAVERSRARSTPIFLARELIVHAAARQRAGDDRIGPLISEARAIASQTGALIVVQDARLFLTRRTVPADPSELSARERDVMVHVRDGDTNQQIAHALGISAATVRKHLEHVFAKLGVSTRTAAVARLDDHSAG